MSEATNGSRGSETSSRGVWRRWQAPRAAGCPRTPACAVVARVPTARMRGRRTVAALAALGAALVSGLAAASLNPFLRSVGAKKGHVVAVFTLGELAPGKIVVAVRPATGADGALLTENVRLREAIGRTTRVRGGYRFQTRHALRPRRYYVQVSGTVVGLDCTPRKPCPTTWSNVRRLALTRP